MRLGNFVPVKAMRVLRTVTTGFIVSVLASSCAIELAVSSAPDHRLASPNPELVTRPDPFVDESAITGSVGGGKSLEERLGIATFAAASRGATFALLFRDLTQDPPVTITNGDTSNTIQAPLASLTKLWIADHLLYEDAYWVNSVPADPPEPDRLQLNSDDKTDIENILKNSDDAAAWRLWNKYGRGVIVEEIKNRYHLGDLTVAPSDGTWWNTISTPGDIAFYYEQLLSSRDAEPPGDAPQEEKNAASAQKNAATQIVQNLEHYNATQSGSCYETEPKEKQQCAAAQTFGFPQALPAEHADDSYSFGMKQARMCCVEGHWVYWSTAFTFTDNKRAILVALSIEKLDPVGSSVNEQHYASTQVRNDDSARHAAATLTGAIMRAFPDGKVP